LSLNGLTAALRGSVAALEWFAREAFIGPEIIAFAPDGILSPRMGAEAVRLYRWDEIALDKVTEMLSRKVVRGDREMIVQVYAKRGCVVPTHAHESEQMTYVLQGALKFVVDGEEIIVREGEVLCIPSGARHQVEALEDTFELGLFSPARMDWIDEAGEESPREART